MRPAPAVLRLSGRLGSADEPGNEYLSRPPSLDVLLDLESKNLGSRHLLVEELDHAAQFLRDLVGNEDHPQSSRVEIGADSLPELIDIRVLTEKGTQRLSGNPIWLSHVASKLALIFSTLQKTEAFAA